MRHRQFGRISLLCASAALVACGSTSLTLTGAKQPARSPSCDSQVLTALPADGYAEVGTIDVQPGLVGSHEYKQLDAFKEKVQPYVCEAGGDAALARANGFGTYMKATILKRVASSAPPGAAQADSGCHFDNQCKGDRVCVQGACADPAKK